jgi:hypothetical protein
MHDRLAGHDGAGAERDARGSTHDQRLGPSGAGRLPIEVKPDGCCSRRRDSFSR